MDKINTLTANHLFRVGLLRAAIHIFNEPSFQPKDGVTHCNQAVADYASEWDYHAFDGLLANDIIDLIEMSPEWLKADPQGAMTAAKENRLTVAGAKANPHGHVAAVLPLYSMVHQGISWKNVPVLSMGRTPIIGRGALYAFGTIPTFWTREAGPGAAGGA